MNQALADKLSAFINSLRFSVPNFTITKILEGHNGDSIIVDLSVRLE